MVASINGNAAVISTACAYFLLIGGWVDAWTTINNNNHIMRIPRNSSDSISTTSTPSSSSSSTSTYSATISATTNELSLRQRQKLLQSALTHARQTDQKFGLSAPESIHAWSIVDELYVAIPEYSSAVEESVRKVFGEKQKSVWDL